MIIYLSIGLFTFICALVWMILTAGLDPRRMKAWDVVGQWLLFGMGWPLVWFFIGGRLIKWLRSDPLNSW